MTWFSDLLAAHPIWTNTLTSTAAVSALGLVFSVPYRKFIETKISSHFDEKLEETKSIFRKDEESLRAALKERGEELASLRSGALSALSNRNSDFERRRIVAVEAVWGAVINLSKYKSLMLFTKSVNMDVLTNEAARKDRAGENTKEFAKTILSSFKIEDMAQDQEADKQRPFLPTSAWVTFSTYRQLVIHAAVQFTVAKFGVGSDKLAKPDEMIAALKLVLPHYSGFLDQYGAGSFPFLVEELEERLLTVLAEALEHKEADTALVKRAANISSFALQVAAESENRPAIPENLSKSPLKP